MGMFMKMSTNCFRYLYCDEVKVTNENVNNLLYAAKKYAVKGLVAQCLLIVSGTCIVMRSRSPMRMLTIYYMPPRNML